MTDNRKKTQFKKGKSGNPKGRPKISPNLRELRKLNAAEFNDLMTKYIRTPPEEMKLIIRRKGVEWLEHMVINLCIEILETRDINRIQFVIDRTMGRETGVIEHKVEVTEKKQPDAKEIIGSMKDPAVKKAWAVIMAKSNADSTKTK